MTSTANSINSQLKMVATYYPRLYVKKTDKDINGLPWELPCVNKNSEVAEDRAHHSPLAQSHDYRYIVTGNKNLKPIDPEHQVIAENVDVIDIDTGCFIARFRTNFIAKEAFVQHLEAAVELAKPYSTRPILGPAKDVDPLVETKNRFDWHFNHVKNGGKPYFGAPPTHSISYGYYFGKERVVGLTHRSKGKKEFKGFLEFVEKIDMAFKKLLPDMHQSQWEESHKGDYFLPNSKSLQLSPNAVHDGTVFPEYLKQPEVDDYQNYIGTSFSTFTVNGDVQTAYHRDTRDLPNGFSNLTVFETQHRYEGGYLVLPEYQLVESDYLKNKFSPDLFSTGVKKSGALAFDVRQGDFLVMDPHLLHGNTEIIGKPLYEKRKPKFSRLSIVCYLLDNIWKFHTSRPRLLPANFLQNEAVDSITELTLINFLGQRGGKLWDAQPYITRGKSFQICLRVKCNKIFEKTIMSSIIDSLYFFSGNNKLKLSDIFNIRNSTMKFKNYSYLIDLTFHREDSLEPIYSKNFNHILLLQKSNGEELKIHEFKIFNSSANAILDSKKTKPSAAETEDDGLTLSISLPQASANRKKRKSRAAEIDGSDYDPSKKTVKRKKNAPVDDDMETEASTVDSLKK